MNNMSSSEDEDISLLDPEALRRAVAGRRPRSRIRTLCTRITVIPASILLACKVIVRIVFVLLNNIYCIPTYLVWMALLHPLKRYHPQLYWRIEGTFFHWLLAMVSMWSWSAGYDIVEVGDDIRQCVEERTLVIANHQSTADVPMLMANFNPRPAVLPNIMWIMDRVFKFTNFGPVSIIHEDFFILSGRRHRESAIVKLKKHLRESYIPRNRRLMVLFPEGGFLRKRREVSQRYALKNNLPVLNHVSLPRLGAMQAIIDICGCRSDKVSPNNNTAIRNNGEINRLPSEHDTPEVNPAEPVNNKAAPAVNDMEPVINKLEPVINDAEPVVNNAEPVANNLEPVVINAEPVANNTEPVNSKETTTNDNKSSSIEVKADCQLSWVLDVTIAYPEGKPLDLPTIITGWRKPCQTYMFYRLYPGSQIPTDAEELTTWLFARWQEKEQILSKFYSTGEVPVAEFCASAAPPQTVLQDPLRFLLLHAFFITSSYLHFRVGSLLLQAIW